MNYLIENPIIPLVGISYQNEITNINSFVVSRIGSGVITTNTNYILVYTYNTINDDKIIASNAKNITFISNGQINITLPLSTDYRIVKRQIFRKLNSESNYKLIYSVNNNIKTFYIDNNLNNINVDLPIDNYLSSYYKYIVTFINQDNTETISSDSININLITPSEFRITLPVINNSRIIGRKIYRTGYDGVTFKLFKYVNNIVETIFYDNIPDNNLGNVISSNLLNVVIPSVLPNQINYKILKMPIQSIAPNLDPFTSFSTDYNFVNSKSISDLNDYLFDKPFIQLVNTNVNTFTDKYTLKNSFVDSYLYFYIVIINYIFWISSFYAFFDVSFFYRRYGIVFSRTY